MTQISVLGPVSVHRGAEAVRVPGGRSAELLVRLALDAGTVVRTDALIDDLWPDEVGGARRNTLQSKVARLRRALGSDPAIETTADGYRLAVAPAQVDASALVVEADEARRLLEDGDPGRAATLAATALDRFEGEVLPSAGTGDWVAPHRARLEEARLTLLVTGAAAHLALDDAATAVGDLEDAVAAHPFHEPLWELLVLALARSGRQADALAAYQRARTVLADELGLDPGPRLRALEAQVLAQDDTVAPRGAPPSRGNLPALAVDLVGRDVELAAVATLMADHRLVEVVGPGGVGKTALALAAARQQATTTTWPGGVWLVRLEEATTAEEVTDALIAALDVTGGDAALGERLRGPAMLVILDSCEHVVDAAAALALRMLDATSHLCVLATTQVPLDVEGSSRVELAPLAPPDAVALFERRAAAQRAHRRPPPDGAVRDLCRALDGLPLAIELAAARTRTLSVEEITRRLDDRFAVLSDPTSRRPERRRALRATIRWSYDLLFPDDQRALWSLAAFSGSAAPDAVESVLAALDVPPAAAMDAVGRLAARSLVIVDEDDPGAVRYRLLDSIRAFALDVVADAGASEQVGAAHATWFAVAADRSTAGVRSADQARHLAFASTERANIDAALTWAATHDPALGVRIAEGFGWAWIVLGDDRGAQRLLTALAAAGPAAPPDRRARALLLAAWIEASTGALDTARVHVAEAEALADDADVDLRARCAYHLAYVVSHEGDWDEGLRLTDVARTAYEGLDRPWDRIANALFATRAAISAGDEARSEAGRDEVLDLLARVDDPWMQVRADAMLGELARLQHRFTDAVDHIGRAADASLRLGFRQTEAYQRASLGRARWQAGDHEAGAADLGLAVDHALAVGDLRMAALARVHLGRTLRALGRVHEARAALDAAVRWHRHAGGGEQAALGECLLAALDARDGDPTAPARLRRLLDDAEAAGDRPHVAVFALDALARHAHVAGDDARAAALADRADAHLPAAAHFISPVDRTDDIRRTSSGAAR